MKEIIINNINTGYFACQNGNIIGKRGKILKPFFVGNDKRKYYAVDILNKNMKYVGVGYNTLILPSKYENSDNEYLNIIIDIINFRGDEIIYV